MAPQSVRSRRSRPGRVDPQGALAAHIVQRHDAARNQKTSRKQELTSLIVAGNGDHHEVNIVGGIEGRDGTTQRLSLPQGHELPHLCWGGLGDTKHESASTQTKTSCAIVNAFGLRLGLACNLETRDLIYELDRID